MGSFGQGDPYLTWRANATTSPSPLPCSCFKGLDARCWAWLCGGPVAISLRNEMPGLALMSSSVPAVLLCFCRLRTGNFGTAEECLQQAHSFSLTCWTAPEPVPFTAWRRNLARAAGPRATLQAHPVWKRGAAKSLTSRKCLSGEWGDYRWECGMGKGRVTAFPEQRHPYRKLWSGGEIIGDSSWLSVAV